MYWDKPFFTVVTMSNTDWIQLPPVCGAEHGWQHFRLENAAFNLNVSFADAIKNFSFHTVRGVRAMNTDTPPEKLSQLIAQLNARGANDYRRYDAVPEIFELQGTGQGHSALRHFRAYPLVQSGLQNVLCSFEPGPNTGGTVFVGRTMEAAYAASH